MINDSRVAFKLSWQTSFILCRFAGAGLYDSVQVPRPELVAVDYSEDPLFTDDAFQADMLARIAAASVAVERAFGAAQDVEGLVDAEGRVHVVQARPQV